MKKIVVFSIVICAAMAFMPAKKKVLNKTESGIEYSIVKKTNGAAVANGELVEIVYKGMYNDKKVFYKTPKNTTRKFVVGSTFAAKGLVEAVKLLKVGEKGIFKMPKKLAFTTTDTFPESAADSIITYEIELKNVKVCPALQSPLVAAQLKDTISGSNGLKVIVAGKGKGAQVKKGGSVYIHYSGYLTNMTQFDASVSRGVPFKTVIGKGMVIQGWDEGIAMLSVGDTARLIIPASMGYGNRAAGKIPANSTLIFDVIVLDYQAPIVAVPYKVEGIASQKTSSGLEYFVVKEGNGKAPAKGSKVSVHYTGYLQDGSIFDSSVQRDEYFTFNVGIGRVIKGWDEGILLMKEGSKFRLVIPYDLAYGEAGYPPVIPAKSTLIFDVELVKLD